MWKGQSKQWSGEGRVSGAMREQTWQDASAGDGTAFLPVLAMWKGALVPTDTKQNLSDSERFCATHTHLTCPPDGEKLAGVTDGRGVPVVPSTQRVEDSSESQEEQVVSRGHERSWYVHKATCVDKHSPAWRSKSLV